MKLKIDRAKFDELFPAPIEDGQDDPDETNVLSGARRGAERALESLGALVPGLSDVVLDLAGGTCSCHEATLRDRSTLRRCVGACNEAKARALLEEGE